MGRSRIYSEDRSVSSLNEHSEPEVSRIRLPRRREIVHLPKYFAVSAMQMAKEDTYLVVKDDARLSHCRNRDLISSGYFLTGRYLLICAPKYRLTVVVKLIAIPSLSTIAI